MTPFDPFLAEAAITSESREIAIPSLSNMIQTTVVSSDNVAMGELFNMPPGVTDYSVNPDSAMRISAFYRCITLLCGVISTLPIHIYEQNAEGDKERIIGDPLAPLLNMRPNFRFTAAAFWKWILLCIFLRGDGYAWVIRKKIGRGRSSALEVSQIIPLNPAQVRVEANTEQGDLDYWVTLSDGRVIKVPSDDMLHFPGFGFDGEHGMSLLSWGARNAISVAGTAEKQQGSMFGSGGVGRHVFTSPNKMSSAQKDDLRSQYEDLINQPARMLPFILTGGMDVSSISMKASDAQLLETRNFQVEEIARVCGVPPHLIGATTKVTAFGKGLEEMGRGFLIYSVQPIIDEITQELSYKLFESDSEIGRFCEFNVSAIARSDLVSRTAAYRQSIGGSQGPGWMTTNEIRKLERLPKVDGGDELFTGMGSSEPEDEDKSDKGEDPEENEDENEEEA